jgi:hypothetical protein
MEADRLKFHIQTSAFLPARAAALKDSGIGGLHHSGTAMHGFDQFECRDQSCELIQSPNATYDRFTQCPS